MPELHVVRVFVGERGAGGNSLGVFLHGSAIPADDRQAVAAALGFSETVFVDDAERGELAIFTPATELDFAGHPLVGTAWVLATEGRPPRVLRPPAGDVGVRLEGETAFIEGRPEWAPPFEHRQLPSPSSVDALHGAPDNHDLIGAWAWDDEAAGVLRARVFAGRLGVPEDEATGSHALLLCARLARPLVINQGQGSLILARPLPDGRVEIGGRTELVRRGEWPD